MIIDFALQALPRLTTFPLPPLPSLQLQTRRKQISMSLRFLPPPLTPIRGFLLSHASFRLLSGRPCTFPPPALPAAPSRLSWWTRAVLPSPSPRLPPCPPQARPTPAVPCRLQLPAPRPVRRCRRSQHGARRRPSAFHGGERPRATGIGIVTGKETGIENANESGTEIGTAGENASTAAVMMMVRACFRDCRSYQ